MQNNKSVIFSGGDEHIDPADQSDGDKQGEIAQEPAPGPKKDHRDHDAEKKQIGRCIELCAEAALRIRFSGDIPVQYIGEADQQIKNDEQRLVFMKKQKRKRENDPQRGDRICGMFQMYASSARLTRPAYFTTKSSELKLL